MSITPPPPQVFPFSKNRNAWVLQVTDEMETEDILHNLRLQKPRPVFMLAAGADKNALSTEQQTRIRTMLNLGIARLARRLGAAIIDGGSQSGIIRMMGEALASENDNETILLGVAPVEKMSYRGKPIAPRTTLQEQITELEPNHTHFVLPEEGAWGDETPLMYELGQYLGRGMPIITLLINGGEITQSEIRQAVRNRWPVIIFEGSGRFADRLASLYHHQRNYLKRLLPGPHPGVVETEILRDGHLYILPKNATVDTLNHLVLKLYQNNLFAQSNETLLKDAWMTLACLDQQAVRQQKQFKQKQNLILLLGVCSVLLVAIQQQGWLKQAFWIGLLHAAIILLPLLVGAALNLVNRLDHGAKWVALRGAAEEIKSEIYHYRTQTGIYKDLNTTDLDATFAAKVELINESLSNTPAMNDSLPPYQGLLPPDLGNFKGEEIDDGLSPLNAEQYLRLRVDEQILFYNKRSQKHSHRSHILRYIMYGASLLGAFLAALGAEIWVSVTTTIFTASLSYLEYQQVETTLRKYNQLAGRLINIRRRWEALSPRERQNSERLTILVENTEDTLRLEQNEWLQQMHESLGHLNDPDKQSRH